MNKERLLLLAEFLETKVPEDRFDYTTVVGSNWKYALDLSCGTVACALGWATQIPELAAEGLTLQLLLENRSMFIKAMQVFNISELDADLLFIPAMSARRLIDGKWREVKNSLGDNASAKEVAAHIRGFVARDGHWDTHAVEG